MPTSRPTGQAEDASLPSPGSVQGLKVVDFGLGLTAALIAKQFAELGARVSRIEPAGGDGLPSLAPA
jgi:crotonobetainyl-CoA:carnitine CoA-transferase CaiB-like acyl-CoA transferase